MQFSPVDFFPFFFRLSPLQISSDFLHISSDFLHFFSDFLHIFSDFLHRRFYRECMKVHLPNGKYDHLNFFRYISTYVKNHQLHIEYPYGPSLRQKKSCVVCRCRSPRPLYLVGTKTIDLGKFLHTPMAGNP
jgi:hypothetical protein